MRVAVVCALLQAASVSAHADQDWVVPESGTAIIQGRVTGGESDRPLGRAEVRLTGRKATWTLIANEYGWFEFRELPAGRYAVSAAMAGYLTFHLPESIEVGDGKVRSGVDLALAKSGVIAVEVTDAFGEPMEGIWVQVQQAQLAHASRDRLELELTTSRRQRTFATDDRGQIRFYDLAPGDYYVSAAGGRPLDGLDRNRARNPVGLHTFYPGVVRLADAQPVTLGLSQELSLGISIVPVPVARLSGRAIREDGSVLRPFGMSMTSLRSSPFLEPPLHPRITEEEFEFVNVLPGDYLIQYRSGSLDPLLNDFGSLEVSVSGSDMTGLVLTVKPAATLKGRIVLDTGEAIQEWHEYDFTPSITIENYGTHELKPESDGTFEMRGLTGRGINWSGEGWGWYLKAVTRGGRDITDLPIDLSPGATLDDIRVFITREHTELTGSVRDAGNATVSDFTVVVFPEDRDRWMPTSRHIATAGADEHGRFSLVGLPPGLYLAAAVDSSTAREYDRALREPGLLERLRSDATAVTLRANESTAVTLRLGGP